jgi:hypothetical protein
MQSSIVNINPSVSSSEVENRSGINYVKQSPKIRGLLRSCLPRNDVSYFVIFILFGSMSLRAESKTYGDYTRTSTTLGLTDVFLGGETKDTLKNTRPSARQEYDLNDPRNPNCPCHKRQQQAEREYQQLQGNLGNFYNNQINDNNGNENVGSGSFGNEPVRVSFGFGKISFNRTKKVKAEKVTLVKDKKVKTRGGLTEVFAFYFMKKKFVSAKTKAIKHRKMRGCFGDKMSRCFHF